MTLWLALRRLLPLLAVVSFALTPVAVPAATVGMHASASMSIHSHQHAMPDMDMGDEGNGMTMAGPAMDDMACCPHEKAETQDCHKGCPLMALCLATAASLLPVSATVPMPDAKRISTFWPDVAALGSLRGPPLPEPPRA